MQKLLFFFGFILFSQSGVLAQCLSLPFCPPATQIFCDLSSNNSQFWHDSSFYNLTTQTHDLGETLTDLSLQIVDSCAASEVQISFVLLLDLNGDAVRETAISSNSLPAAGIVYYGSAPYPNYNGGQARYFDTRPVPDSEKFSFVLEKVVQDSLITARIRWVRASSPGIYGLPELPYGTHRVEWRFERNGEVRICKYNFTIKDCQPPVLTCTAGVSLNILPSTPPFIQVSATNFLQSVEDNNTPLAQLQYGIRRSGTGGGFPVNSPGVQFTCSDLGTQPIEIWVKDLYGNADYCESYVIVQDNLGACSGSSANIEICAVSYCNNEPIPYVDFEVSGSHPAIPPFSLFQPADSTGCLSNFINAIPLSSNLTITPLKDNNPLNGVTTYDLVLISRHILGIEPLSSPYKMIAADANKSGSITTADVVELRKLILGIYQELPTNTSWRFIDKSFTFPNPNNPFSAPFPENTTIANIQSTTPNTFYGIKIGDVNCNALNAVPNVPEEEALTIPNLHLQANDEVEVPVHFLQTNDYYGFQFGLHFDSAKVEVLEVIPVVGTQENFGLFTDRVHTSWSAFAPAMFVPDEPVFRLRIKARSAVQLADAFSLATGPLRAEAYPANDSLVRLVLQFATVATNEPDASQTIFAPQPNPTTAGLRIPLRLEQSENVIVEILDGTGRLLYQQVQTTAAGPQWLEVPATALPQAGVYMWRVQAGKEFKTGKIVRQ